MIDFFFCVSLFNSATVCSVQVYINRHWWSGRYWAARYDAKLLNFSHRLWETINFFFLFFFCCLFFSLYLFIYLYCTYSDHLLMLFYGPVDDWGATVVQFNTIQMRRWTGDCWLDDRSSINERLIDLPVSISNLQNWMWWAMACCWQVFKAHRWRRHSGSLCFHIVFKKVWLRHYQFIGVFLSAFRSQLVRWTQSISTKSPALQRLKRRDPVQFLKSCWGHVNLSARIAAILGDLLANLE